MLYFHKAIRKYGEDCFEHKILEVCHSLEDVLKREIYWIDRLHTTVDENGYNMTKGGEGNLMPEAVKERHKLATSTGTRQAFLRQEVKENHRKAMEAVYKRPGMLASRGKAISAALSDPETKLKMSVASKRAWQNSEKLLNRRKQTQQLTASNEAVALFSSAREAARVTGVAQGNISKCARGEINLAGGFKWRYVENP
jgi:group I intron endonuclease